MQNDNNMTLKEFFSENKKAALAFSGGCDSAYLLYAAKKWGADVRAYFVKTPFQPRFELEDALRLGRELDAQVTVIETDILLFEDIAQNPPQRCYLCKREIFSKIKQRAAEDGYLLLIDGTNVSDNADDRPGTKAAQELDVRSPLLECGIDKENIRELSREAGLFTWDKPAYSCLATRIPVNERITVEKLAVTEAAENYLFSLGFSDLRVRSMGSGARLRLRESQLSLLLEHREEVLSELKKYYTDIVLDLEVR